MKLSQNFSRSEFTCRCGCRFNTVDHELVEVLENVRANFNAPVSVNSGCRCPAHNVKIGGSANSQHLHGRAADIVVQGVPSDQVASYLSIKYPNEYGIGRYDSFTHIDTRSGWAARWRG